MGARYVTWLNDREVTVELVELEGARVVARIEDGDDVREHVLNVRRSGGTWVARDAGGTVSRGTVVARDEQRQSITHGFAFGEVRVINERDALLGGADAGAGGGEVTVAMPGRVVKVLAAVGESVEKGQSVLIIEAMKMENDVRAKRDGVITAIHVSEGDSVEADRVMMEIGEPS